MKRDRLTKHDRATIEALGAAVGLMFAMSLSAFLAAVFAYIEIF